MPALTKRHESQSIKRVLCEICRFTSYGINIIDWGPGYRIYLAKDGDTLIVLFGGGTKRGQQQDIDRAKALLSEYKTRKKTMAVKSSSKHKG